MIVPDSQLFDNLAENIHKRTKGILFFHVEFPQTEGTAKCNEITIIIQNSEKVVNVYRHPVYLS